MKTTRIQYIQIQALRVRLLGLDVISGDPVLRPEVFPRPVSLPVAPNRGTFIEVMV